MFPQHWKENPACHAARRRIDDYPWFILFEIAAALPARIGAPFILEDTYYAGKGLKESRSGIVSDALCPMVAASEAYAAPWKKLDWPLHRSGKPLPDLSEGRDLSQTMDACSIISWLKARPLHS